MRCMRGWYNNKQHEYKQMRSVNALFCAAESAADRILYIAAALNVPNECAVKLEALWGHALDLTYWGA